jgi:flagellar protein FliO/FliZ
MDQLMLALRVVVSLAIVLGLMWGLTKVTRGRTTVRGVPLDVVSRAPLGKHSSVAVLRVGGRGMVVGVTEHQITLLGEIELEPEPEVTEVRETLDLQAELGSAVAPVPSGRRAAREATTTAAPALAGSVLSPATWRDMAAVLRDRSVRS